MVKGEREDDKFMSPMFPRLHVNDTDKGGPRAPPRNKMALYEQLSIPSHRFHSTAASVLPLPPHNASTLISSASSQGCGHERSVLSPCYVPPNAPGKVHSHSSNRKISAAAIREFKRPVRHGDQGSSYAAYSIADCNLLHPHDAYDSKNSCDEDDDFRVPTFVYSEFAKCSSKNMPVKETKKSSASGRKKSAESYSCTINSSAQLPNSYDKPLEQKSAGVVTARKHKRNHSEQMFEETIGTVEFAFHPDNGGKLAEPSTYSKASLDHECTRIRNAIEKTCPANTEKSQESFVNGCPGELECLDSRDVTEDSDARLRSGCSSKSSPRSSLKDPNVADNCYQKLGDKASVSLELGDGDRNGEMSDTMVDSMVGLNISPDDVVGVIGSKQFWTARTAITNQQRVFTLQLFELHRLIKVQKLLAASPHLLLGDDRDSDSSTPELPVKNLPAESNIEFQPPMIEQKDDTLEQNQNIKCPTEKRGVHPTPDDDDDDDDANRKLDQLPNNEPCSGKSPAVSVVPDDRPSPWCFQPPSNQWLVPVMSPTEGLIYKPCTGFCPPSAGFVAPIYGFQGPLQLPVVGDFMNQANGVPVSNQQQNMGTLFRSPRVHLNYLPVPYGLPVVNPIIPASVVEQASSMTMPVGQTEQLSWISCDMLNASKDCRLQGSTASSPSERVQGEGRDAPAFHLVGPPTEGSSQLSQSNERDHGTHVIKVVPHTANSATQSAARIFQSIQEERGLLG